MMSLLMVISEHQVMVWFNGELLAKVFFWAFGKPNGCTQKGVNSWNPDADIGWTLFLTLNKRENRIKINWAT